MGQIDQATFDAEMQLMFTASRSLGNAKANLEGAAGQNGYNTQEVQNVVAAASDIVGKVDMMSLHMTNPPNPDPQMAQASKAKDKRDFRTEAPDHKGFFSRKK